MKHIVLVFTAILFLSGSLRASPPDCVFEHYTSLDGMPHNAVSDIHQDGKGFVWLCTWYGLSRFDGYTFHNYLTLPGDYSPLSHNRFLRITEDVRGYLWLTTYDNKLYRFDKTKEEFTGIPHSLPGFEGKDYRVETYLGASDGATWISIAGAGLIRASQDDPSKPIAAATYFDSPALGKRVTLMMEDSRGRIWAASESGVAVLTPENGEYTARAIYDKPVTQLVEINEGVCMVSKGKLVIADKETLKPAEHAMPQGEQVQTITPGPNHINLYIGTLRSGVAHFDTKTGLFRLDGHNIGRVRNMVFDSHATLWVTTDRAGITRYDKQARTYKSFEQKMNVVSYYVDTMTKIVERDDRVWIKMNRVGFGYYDRERDEVMPFYNDPAQGGARFRNGVVCFTVDSSNVLWMSTQTRGLEKVTVIRQLAQVFGPGNGENLAGREIRALATDRDKVIWAGNKDGGLFCYDTLYRPVRRFPDARHPQPIGRVYAIFQDSRDDMWIGTKGNGLLRMQRRGGEVWEITRFTHSASDPWSLSHDDVYSVAEDAKGRIWVATFGGGINLLEWTDGKPRFYNPSNSFPNYPAGTGERARYLLLKNATTMIAATIEGLIFFDPSQQPDKMTFTTVQKIPGDRNSLGNNDVIHMFKDYRGRVWLSTFGGGLNLMRETAKDETPRFQIFASEEGLSSNIVFAATQDYNGNIWLSTENGISCFVPSTGTFSNYSKYDGIPAAGFSEATAVTDATGNVLFGGMDGIWCINPDSVDARRDNFMLTFTGLQVRNEDVSPGEKSPLQSSITECEAITLPYDYSVLRIEYASLNSRMQPSVSYMYTLEGYERDWNMAHKERSASYSNVPPGTYDLRVSCYADDNPMQRQQITMRITILPPPWRTGWAYLIYVVIGLSLLWVVMKTLVTMFSLRHKVQLEEQMTELKLGFFTNISHELRSPLTLILGGIDEVRKREALTARGETNIRLAQKNAQRMLTMINQLLDFRKIVGGKMELKVAQVDISQLAADAAEVYTEMATERNVAFTVKLPLENFMVWVDPERIGSVIDNLLSNAFKFTPEGGAITLSVESMPGSRFFIRVSDTGIGITKENMIRIFEHFGQTSSSVWSNMKGSGIGLSLCKEIVALHKGRIDVDSRPDEGAVFTVTLPIGDASLSKGAGYASGQPKSTPKPAPDASAAAPAPKPAAPITREVSTKGPDALTVMVVEDNKDVRAFLHNLLIDEFNIIEAEDGALALQMLQGGAAPDVVVTDLMMPNMDGIELTGAIRDDFDLSHLPVIILTARSAVESRISATRYGADDYITKPFNAEHLMASIGNLLTRRRRLTEKYSAAAAAASPGKVIDLSPGEILVTDRDEEFIRTAMEWIGANIENPELTIDQLATHLGMGRTTMYKKLKSLTGKSPVELIKDYRIAKARLLLETGQFTVSEVAYKVGFSDPSYFSKCFKEHFHVSPVDYLKK